MPQAIARGLQVGDIGGLVGGVGDNEDNVDHRFGGEPRHGRRSDVLNLHRPLAQRGTDAVPFADIPARPGRVRLRKPHWSVDPHRRDQELWKWHVTHTCSIPLVEHRGASRGSTRHAGRHATVTANEPGWSSS